MLYLTRDAASDVYLGMNGNARLAYLPIVVGPACIYGSPTCSHLTMQFLGKLEKQVETLFATHTIATSHNDGRTLEVVLGLFNVAREHLHHITFGLYVVCYVGINGFSLIVVVQHLLLHHTTSHRSHLWSVVGVNDRCHDISTEGGTNLVKQLLVMFACFLVIIVANLQLGAVCGKSASKRRRNARSQIATDNGCAHQADLWFLLFEEVHEDVGMWCRRVWEEPFGIKDEELIYAVRQNLGFNMAFDARARNHGMELHTKLVGQTATFGQQFLRHFGHRGVFYLAIYKYVVHVFFKVLTCSSFFVLLPPNILTRPLIR